MPKDLCSLLQADASLTWASLPPAHLIVFDSGVGGLNVLKTLWSANLGCPISFVADSAWMPYGDKDPQLLRERLLQLVGALLNRHCENSYILFACNTASAVWESIPPDVFAQHGIRPDRVIDILRPTLSLLMRELIARLDADQHHAHVGLMATPLTVNSMAYPTLARRLYGKSSFPQLTWQSVPCAGLAQAVEGNPDVESVDVLLHRYGSVFEEAPPEALIIGCTHYLGLKASLRRYMPDTIFIDPSEALVLVIAERLGIAYERQSIAVETGAGKESVRLLATGRVDTLTAYLASHLPALASQAFDVLSLD
ncbi:MAG: glutamate racemase [Vampirovibrionales bacterium]|jgi:glutamate racemase